jgi:hypothetical protein
MKKFTQYNEETKSIETGQNTEVSKIQPKVQPKVQPKTTQDQKPKEGQTSIIKNGQNVEAQDAQYTQVQDAQQVKSCKYITMDLISMLKDIQQQNKKYYELIENLEKQSQQTPIQQNTQTQQTALSPKKNIPIQNT